MCFVPEASDKALRVMRTDQSGRVQPFEANGRRALAGTGVVDLNFLQRWSPARIGTSIPKTTLES
jgi:hypothetical protein